MTGTQDPLDTITIASPCTEDWNRMTGDERRRYCELCHLHVHDLSQMTRDEARELLRGASERVCVRLFRRPDGRVLTRDCVTVRERLRRRARRLRVAAAALFSLFLPLAGGCGQTAPVGGGATGAVAPPEAAPDRPAAGGAQNGSDPVPLLGEVCVPEPAVPEAGEPGDPAGAEEPGQEGLIEELGEVAVEPGERLGRVALPAPPERPATDDPPDSR